MTPGETLRVLGTLMEAVGEKTDRTINKEFDATACVTYTAKVFATLDDLDKNAANAVRAKLAEEPECPACDKKLEKVEGSVVHLTCPEHGHWPREALDAQYANEPVYDMLTVTTVDCWGTEIRVESEYGYRWSAYYDTEFNNGDRRMVLCWEKCFLPRHGEIPSEDGATLKIIEKLLLGAGDWSSEDPRKYEPDPMGSLSDYE